jgi:hypothetical protein
MQARDILFFNSLDKNVKVSVYTKKETTLRGEVMQKIV